MLVVALLANILLVWVMVCVCAGSRCMRLQIWVNELGKQEHRVQNVLKNEHKPSEGLISTIWKLE